MANPIDGETSENFNAFRLEISSKAHYWFFQFSGTTRSQMRIRRSSVNGGCNSGIALETWIPKYKLWRWLYGVGTCCISPLARVATISLECGDNIGKYIPSFRSSFVYELLVLDPSQKWFWECAAHINGVLQFIGSNWVNVVYTSSSIC